MPTINNSSANRARIQAQMTGRAGRGTRYSNGTNATNAKQRRLLARRNLAYAQSQPGGGSGTNSPIT